MKYILALLITSFSLMTTPVFAKTTQTKLKQLENTFHGKIGVYAIDTNNGEIIAYREDDLFPVESTSKLIAAADVLKISETKPKLLQKRITYKQKDIVAWSPATEQHILHGMTMSQLAAAAISYSDDTAMNLIMKTIGGPQSVTTFAHSIGNKSFNIKHYETNLNSNPKNKDDTSTPKDMAISLQKLTLGNVLSLSKKKQLLSWMKDNTTGYKRIRSGVPTGWTVADKTGSGSYGVANDIGIMWSPACKPIIIAIYTIRNKSNAKSRDDVLASVTKIVFDGFATKDSCFNVV